MKRLITIAFIGFIFGLFNLSLFRSEKQQTDWAIGIFTEPLIYILATITVLLTILTVVYIIQIKLKAKMSLTGEKEDIREEWLYKKYSELNFLSTSVFVLAFTTSTIIVSTNDNSKPLMLFILVLMIFSVFVPFLSNKLAKVVYTHREIPSQTDKYYMQKVLASADEGERYIILEGLYKAYIWMNALLPLSIFLLSIYWGITGDTQMFAILLIAVVMIILNAGYLLKVRKMY